MVDFTAFKHPVMAVPCPDCRAKAGAYCTRPSAHRAADFHASRKAASDELFIAQHGEDAWIERLDPGDRWKVHATGRQQEIEEATRDADARNARAKAADQRRELEARARQSKMRTSVPQQDAGPLFGGDQGELW